MIGALTLVGDAGAVHRSVADLAQAGLTELVFNPAGGGIPRQLERFAEATMSLRGDAAVPGAAG